MAAPTLSPAQEYYLQLHKDINELYTPCHHCLAKEGHDKMPQFDDKLFDRAARHIYGQGKFDTSMLSDKPVRAVIDATHHILADGLEAGLEYDVPKEVRYALDNNAYIFSGFKVYNSLKEVGLSLTTDKGDIKPYSEFFRDVRAINAKYNHNYLEAEYDHAVGSALMASKWVEQERGGGALQYRTAKDNAVRPEHQRLDGITLLSSDPFWAQYYPPNGWRCRCDVVEVLRKDYALSDSAEASKIGDTVLTTRKERMFAYNPGKELRLYPDKHPYYGKRGIDHCGIGQHAEGETDGAGNECAVLNALLELPEEYINVETTRGKLRYHRDIGAHELSKNIIVGKYLAERYGDVITLLPEITGEKSADSYCETRGQKEEYKVLESHTLNALKKAIRTGAHQANDIVLWLSDEMPKEVVARALGSKFKDFPDLKTVRVVYESGSRDVVYKREDYT